MKHPASPGYIAQLQGPVKTPGNKNSRKTATKFWKNAVKFPRAPAGPGRKVIHRLSPVFYNWGVWEFDIN